MEGASSGMSIIEFVSKCGELLNAAKPHLLSCEYRLGKDMPPNKFKQYMDEDEYVLVTCENGYTYDILITGNSLCATANAIFEQMGGK